MWKSKTAEGDANRFLLGLGFPTRLEWRNDGHWKNSSLGISQGLEQWSGNIFGFFSCNILEMEIVSRVARSTLDILHLFSFFLPSFNIIFQASYIGFLTATLHLSRRGRLMPIGGNVTFFDMYKHTQTWCIRYLRGMKKIRREKGKQF